MKIQRTAILILAVLLIFLIAFFSIFGNAMRDYYSAKITYTRLTAREIGGQTTHSLFRENLYTMMMGGAICTTAWLMRTADCVNICPDSFRHDGFSAITNLGMVNPPCIKSKSVTVFSVTLFFSY